MITLISKVQIQQLFFDFISISLIHLFNGIFIETAYRNHIHDLDSEFIFSQI